MRVEMAPHDRTRWRRDAGGAPGWAPQRYWVSIRCRTQRRSRYGTASASTGREPVWRENDCYLWSQGAGHWLIRGTIRVGARDVVGSVFPGEERQLGLLRRWLESLLPACPARDDVACVAIELGTNAIVHTASGRGGWFAVEITWHRPVVRVAVADCGAPDGPRVIDDPEGEHGRGLLVVRGLSVRTGACGDQRGRLVWADVAWDDAGAAEPASSQDPYEAVIRDGQARLASLPAEVPAWFGRSTLQWWALAGGELVAAPSAQELARLLGRVMNPAPPWPPAAGETG